MDQNLFPTIDTAATGRNIQRLRKESGLTVRDLQDYFGFEDPQAIYRWQWGRSLPSVDNLYALSVLLHVPMNEILVPQTSTYHTTRKTADRAVFSFIFVVGVDTKPGSGRSSSTDWIFHSFFNAHNASYNSSPPSILLK